MWIVFLPKDGQDDNDVYWGGNGWVEDGRKAHQWKYKEDAIQFCFKFNFGRELQVIRY